MRVVLIKRRVLIKHGVLIKCVVLIKRLVLIKHAVLIKCAVLIKHVVPLRPPPSSIKSQQEEAKYHVFDQLVSYIRYHEMLSVLLCNF